MFKRLFNLFGKELAMDLGTANTLLYTPREGIIINEPSVVAIDQKRNSVLAVGAEAKTFLGRTPEGIQAIRPMKDGVIADFEVTKAMIAYFVKKALAGWRLSKPKMVICVPTGITQVEKRAVIESALQAGARSVKLVEEPMAAAIGAGLPIHQPRGNMVVDIGGGTTEVAVISMSAVAYYESVRVAGDEMNECVQRYVQDVYQMSIGENQAERIKMAIGSAGPLPEPMEMEIQGKSTLDGKPIRAVINDDDVRNALREPVVFIQRAVRRALEKTPAELVADIADNGLLLAGGGALLKGLDKLLEATANIAVRVDDDPLTTVVRGSGRTLEDPGLEKVFIN